MKKRAKKAKKKHTATASKARARAKSHKKHPAKGHRRKARRTNPTAMLHNPASHVIVLAQERGRTMKKGKKSAKRRRRGKSNPHRHHKKLAGAAAVSHLAKRQEKRSRRRRRGKKNPIDFKEFGGMLLKGGIGAGISAVLNLGLVSVLPLTMSPTVRTIAQVGATAAAAGAALMAKQPAIAAGIVGGGMGGVAELALAKVVTPKSTSAATQAKSVSGFGTVHQFAAIHEDDGGGFGAVHDGFGNVVNAGGNPFFGPVG